MSTRRILGIDLGTTYSCISYVDEAGHAVVIPNSEGEQTTPSVVHFESPTNIVVGKEAKRVSKVDPERIVQFVKRYMGAADYSFSADGKAYRAEEVSAFVLKKLAADAGAHLQETVTDVVITCPAYFGTAERQATINAGEIAGLKVHAILNEPTAAAICYGLEKAESEQNVLVYDLGGGTFDVTVIAVRTDANEVVVTDGNHALGGKDWDDRLVTFCVGAFMAEHPDKGDPNNDGTSIQDVVLAAEDAKKALSAKGKTSTRLMVTHGGARSGVEITREKFEELTRDLLDQTISLTRSVIERANAAGVKKIDRVLLVGGSSRMPAVAARLESELGLTPQLFEPDFAVAKGAALVGLKIAAGEEVTKLVAAAMGVSPHQVDLTTVAPSVIEEASQKAGQTFGLPGTKMAELVTKKIITRISKSFGVEGYLNGSEAEKRVFHLIHNNEILPIELTDTEHFTTLTDNQTAIDIKVMEQTSVAESSLVEDNREIADGAIEGLPPNLRAGSPVHITFKIAEDGTFHITALEPSSNCRRELTARVDGVMSKAEVEESRKLMLKMSVA